MPNFEYDKDYPFAAFITNLGKYNEGELVGEWVKFPKDSTLSITSLSYWSTKSSGIGNVIKSKMVA